MSLITAQTLSSNHLECSFILLMKPGPEIHNYCGVLERVIRGQN